MAAKKEAILEKQPLISIIEASSDLWKDEDDEILLNRFLMQVRDVLKMSNDLDSKQLEELMNVTEKVMRRKRINQRGYDSVPATELKRIEEKQEEEGKGEKQFSSCKFTS